MDIINELREHKDPLTRETAQSYVKNFNLLRTRTELVDQKFGLAREKYIKYS
jgi:hypothetical protein